MLQRNFGDSARTVSALGFGAGHIGYDDVTEREAHCLLDQALDPGVTFIDTARGYGLSEERIGSWLSDLGGQREAVVLSTTVGYDVNGAEDWSAAAAAVGRGPLPDSERRRWEDAFTPHAPRWAGEV